MRLLCWSTLLIVLVSVSSIWLATLKTHAAAASWVSSPISIDQQDDSIYSLSLSDRNCRFQDNVPIKGIGFTAACVTEGTKVKFAYSGSGTYIAKGRDQTFYPLAVPQRILVLSPDSDTVTEHMIAGLNSTTFAVHDDASARLKYVDGYYTFRSSQPKFLYQQPTRFFVLPHLSNNGSFAAYVSANSNNTELVVKTVNLSTGVTKSVGYILDAETYLNEMFRNIVVSDDGEYVAINTSIKPDDDRSSFRTVQIWRTTNCNVEASLACETRLVRENVPDIGIPSGLEFNDTATTVTLLNYMTAEQTDDYRFYRTTFSIEDLFRAKRLDYLAMGDSYSSGEGDTDGMHYLFGTNILGDALHPQEMCHVSDRSYPFLLQSWLMPNRQMKSVACSGAQVRYDYTGSERGYKGQEYRLENLSSVMTSQMKQDALDISFIPGRNKQISFVKKYQPKAVTITGGGNDVDFAYLLGKCAVHSTTCEESYVSMKLADTGYRIQTQYEKLTKLYRDLNIASPRTKIYAVGYPQFVSEGNDPCEVNIGMNKTERKFVREGVVMMNDVIEAAANTAGVKYVDIESALGANILCGTSEPEYVTGISTDKFWRRASSRGFFSSESFHPNAKGHHAIANAIKSALGGKSPIEYSYCRGNATVCPSKSRVSHVPLTPYFAAAYDTSRTQIGEKFAPWTLQPFVNPSLPVRADQLGQGSATVRIESTPRTLGVVEVGEDGVLDADFTVPNDIEPGVHTLYIDALTPAGEPITLWQHITVYGRDGDVDGNGVDDMLQPCPFTVGDLQDSDSDGVDDRCDAEIGLESGPVATSAPGHGATFIDERHPSNVSSTGVRSLLDPDVQLSIQRSLGYDDTDVSAFIAKSQEVYSEPFSPKTIRGVSTTSSLESRNSAVLLFVLGISAAIVLCILTLAGFIYAKNRSKKL